VRKITIFFGILVIALTSLQAHAQTRQDERLFEEAKILIFDKEWEGAKEKLDELLDNFPRSPWFSQALFYKGRCLQEHEGKEEEALAVYKKYLLLGKRNESLVQESEISIIDLAYRLYEKRKRSYSKEIEKRLFHSDRIIKYYAAFKLSYIKDKKLAKKGIPVLKEIVEEERDDELRDRAKIALLRIDPDALKEFEEEKYETKVKIFHIRIHDRWKKDPVVSINIPWALADLALNSIPEEERAELKEEGYDIDKIIKELTEFKGKIIEITGKKTIFRIWID